MNTEVNYIKAKLKCGHVVKIKGEQKESLKYLDETVYCPNCKAKREKIIELYRMKEVVAKTNLGEA